jgi:hypothetical protein
LTIGVVLAALISVAVKLDYSVFMKEMNQIVKKNSDHEEETQTANSVKFQETMKISTAVVCIMLSLWLKTLCKN